ncbi:MAG: lipoate--protein ligase [Gammaproteobacteria bacterium]|nr:lipoate--protein ligase [Gammaproteobacteria bacterium]
MKETLYIRELGLQEYLPVWAAMRQFTDKRQADTGDELWLVEHPAIFTLGQAGKEAHILNPGTIPVVRTDRGGQVTYHGPGQLVAYVLLDLRRCGMGVRQLVATLEQIIITLLADYQIKAMNKCDAPGVYVEGEKICSIGLRVRRGCTYHGLALNFAMDLKPFTQINPCGFSNLTMTQFTRYVKEVSKPQIITQLIAYMVKKLGYTSAHVLASENSELLAVGVHNV